MIPKRAKAPKSVEALMARVAELESALRNAAAVWERADVLTAWRANPRKNDHAVERVAASIQRFGWGAPLLVRLGEIIAGHTRIKALLWLLAQVEKVDAAGFIIAGPRFVPRGSPPGTEPGFVPVRYMNHLSEEDAHILALADNKLNEVAVWDDEALVAQLRAMPVERHEDSGFSTTELKALLADYAPPFDGPAPAEIDDKGLQRFIVRVPIGQVARAKEVVLAAFAAAGIRGEVG
jgi:ParB-like chromosome segregation protein Spo0J